MLKAEQSPFETTNINSKWLDNIYENLKNLEMMERLAMNGCKDIFEYFSIPYEQRQILLADTQYQNLKMMVSEFGLAITDLEPVIEESLIVEFREELYKIEQIVSMKHLFVFEPFSEPKKRFVSSSLKPFFYSTLDHMRNLRARVIHSISDILYVKKESSHASMNKIAENILER